MMRSKIEFLLPTPARRAVRSIDSGVYFVGRLVSVKSLPGFDAVENKGVFYRLTNGVTFLENDNAVNGRGGRHWPFPGNESSEPVGGAYVENFQEVHVTVSVKPAA